MFSKNDKVNEIVMGFNFMYGFSIQVFDVFFIRVVGYEMEEVVCYCCIILVICFFCYKDNEVLEYIFYDFFYQVKFVSQ